MKHSVIYVDIESLFDLRQGFLATSDFEFEKLSDYLLSEAYNFRETDQLLFVNPTAYREAMREPDVRFLENSTITRILLSVKSKVDNIENRNKYYNETTVPEVMLNVYPFSFPEDKMEHIRNLLFYKLGSDCLVSVVRIEPVDVSPFFFKSSNVVSAFIYDMSTWVNNHIKALETVRIPDTILYFPSVLAEKPSEKEMKEITKLGFKDVHSYTEYIFSTVASVNFLPTVFYSNIVTALSHLKKFDESIKKDFGKNVNEEHIDDIIAKVPIP